MNQTENNQPKTNQKMELVKKIFLNRYFFTGAVFVFWMTFIDNTSWLVVRNLNQEINKYEEQLAFYKGEFEKNEASTKDLCKTRMKKRNTPAKTTL